MQHLKDEQEEVGKRGERVLCNVWLLNSMKSARIPTHRKDSNQKYSVCGVLCELKGDIVGRGHGLGRH